MGVSGMEMIFQAAGDGEQACKWPKPATPRELFAQHDEWHRDRHSAGGGKIPLLG